MTTTRLSTVPMVNAEAQTATKPRPELRKDFQAELEGRLEGWLGRPGTQQRTKIESLVDGMLGEPDSKGLRHFDLDKLDEKKLAELKRLEKASEDFEAVFIKGMLSKMRQTKFGEDEGPMGEMARDFMDQAVAESIAGSHNSMGIAKRVFVEMAERVVNTKDLAEAKTGE